MFSRRTPLAIEDGATPSGDGSSARYSTKGTYGLKKCHDSEDAMTDIVFVHGLTGNRETTWTDKASGVFWPAHLLKNDVPRTRIVTFGYDADVVHFWAAASQNRIRNHATNLVNALAQLRERTDTEDRPLIFVTHSLGGLVFEDAMIASRNSAEPHIRRVYEATYGVCFLATPHCGSTLASWATILGQIANVVKKTDTGILQALQPESEVLALIQTDFHNMIVPKHSAILPAYNAIGIHNNHMDMPKFTSEEDPGYLSVSTEVLRWVREIQKAPPPRPMSSSHRTESRANQARLRFPGRCPMATATRDTPPSGMGWHNQGMPGMVQMPMPTPPAQSPGVGPGPPQGYVGSIVTGTVNNYAGSKMVQGNNFQGPVNF
ncbi:unnamed protein product [Parascedosporium putredinis]|uniref:DUF676 domain-containing protein n=1 Tax=Parascedosporium putredinis TaxID=1442378 RepID=A0A9P1M9C3_9PEZI|nr:unnamed protein product [Parascedosporium putredinis]CAI7991759.1 unnamed protein product [Parascedosporium putredinis]